MKKLLCLFSFFLIIGFAAQGAGQKPKEAPAKTRPFRGTIKTIDKAAQTIVLRGEKAQTFKIIPETKIRRDGKPITFADIAVGETLGGFARQAPAGHWEALTLNFGNKVPEAAGAAAAPATPKSGAKQPKAK